MTTLIYAYITVSLIGLTLLLIILFKTHCSVSDMKERLGYMRDKWAQTEARTKKIEKAADWFLERRGFKLDFSNITWDWFVVPMHKGHELDECWRQIQIHREEIVYALYEANKRALEDHEKEKKNKGKKKN